MYGATPATPPTPSVNAHGPPCSLSMRMSVDPSAYPCSTLSLACLLTSFVLGHGFAKVRTCSMCQSGERFKETQLHCVGIWLHALRYQVRFFQALLLCCPPVREPLLTNMLCHETGTLPRPRLVYWKLQHSHDMGEVFFIAVYREYDGFP